MQGLSHASNANDMPIAVKGYSYRMRPKKAHIRTGECPNMGGNLHVVGLFLLRQKGNQ